MKNTFLTLTMLAAATACTSTTREKTGENINPKGPAVRVEGLFDEGIGSGSGTHMGGGNILTNKHVCDMLLYAKASRVITHDGSIYAVQGMYNSPDPVIDLCLLRTNARALPKATFGDANQVLVGKIVNVTGYPSGLYATMQGRVLGSTIIFVFDGFLLMPEFLSVLGAPSAPGSSGSGIYDQAGGLVGVLNAGDGRVTLFVPLHITKEFYDAAVRSFEN